MKVLLKKIAPVVLLAPYLCAFTGNPEISAAIAAGGGSYAEVTRDCNGNVNSVIDHPYSEYAASLGYQFSGFSVGVTGGRTTGFRTRSAYLYVPDGSWSERAPQPVYYLTPSIGYSSTYGGVDIGYLFSLNSKSVGLSNGELGGKGMPAGTLRLGRLDKVHFSTSFAMNFPLLAGGGLVDAGLGFPVGSSGSRMWAGLGGYPYDGVVLSLKGDINLSDQLAITPTLHAKGGDAFEYGYSIGGRVTF